MRSIKIVPNEYYHLYNRGIGKQDIFLDEMDWFRFLFLILHMQSKIVFPQISRSVSRFSCAVKNRALDSSNATVQKIIKNRYIELNAFTLMPNHFHLLTKESAENGISQYMHRVLTAYTKYFNTKYQKSGHLFQGPFQIVRVEDNEQLLHLSAYVHRNPHDIKEWRDREKLYPWSSYQDYIKENRWGNLLSPRIILEQFDNANEYKYFTDTSGTKTEEISEYLIA